MKFNFPTLPRSTVDELVDIQYQQRLLHVVLQAFIIIVLLQSTYYAFVGLALNAAFSIIIVLALWLAYAILSRDRYDLSSSLTVLSALALLVFSILTGGLDNTTAFWFFVFPVIATFLKGKRGGSIWLLSVVLTILTLFFAVQLGYIQTEAIEYNASTFFQIILGVFIVAIFVHFYQDSLETKSSILSEKEAKLSEIYTQLQDEIKQRQEAADSLEKNLQTMSRQKARDEALLQSIGEGVIATDIDGRIIFVNDVTRQLFNYYDQDITERDHQELFQLYDEEGNQIDQGNNPLTYTLQEQRSYQTSSYYYRDYNQQLVPVAITTSPIELNDEAIGVIEVFRDITQERAAARAKDEFLSLASHQLRTPLGAIRWYSERLLKTTRLQPKNRSYLQSIYEDSARMSSLLTDYLNASRIELKSNTLNIQPVCLSEIIDSILSDLDPLIKEKELEIVRHEQQAYSLTTDEHLVEMVLQNLISNAVKYTPKGGTVTISMQLYVGKDPELADAVVINVEDTGIGIPQEEQVNVFSKLFRADNANKHDIEGTGLGLYTAKQATERLGGSIWFESTPDKGTHFAVTLPPLEAESSDTIRPSDKEESYE